MLLAHNHTSKVSCSVGLPANLCGLRIYNEMVTMLLPTVPFPVRATHLGSSLLAL